MLPDLEQQLREYVQAFNRTDEELNVQAVANDAAYDFLKDQIPLFDCPDEQLKQTYYFRWWTFRKHWKETPCGHILSEFLPAVPWAGPYNSINCAAGHHLMEGRWLRDSAGWLREYLCFWLNEQGDAYRYSMWLISAAEAYFSLHPDDTFERACFNRMTDMYEKCEQLSRHPCGLYWSNDGRDGMELSISGSGIRPTLNAYMYGDAMALSRMAEKLGMPDISRKWAEKAEQIHRLMDHYLWNNGFYRVIPCEKDEAFPTAERPNVPPEHDVREELGYIPWYFHMPDAAKDEAFRLLTDPWEFAAPAGITTAERKHPRYLFEHEHECLWNGYVWPFATSQTLTAAANMMRDHGTTVLTREDLYAMLSQYSRSHVLTRQDGSRVPWIDEVLHPDTGRWSARDCLQADHWNPVRGGYERGKDYNHSTFCDLVLSALLGIRIENGELTADPLIPADWDYFCVTNLLEDRWCVLYDRTGEHYGQGSGLQCFRM